MTTFTKENIQTLSDEELISSYKRLKAESERYGVLQLALKVLANSGFGAIANKYFMFFDNRMAESITSTGQFIIQEVGKTLSDHTSKILGVSKDYNVYNDTDSAIMHYGDIVRKYFSTIDDEQKITDMLDAFVKKKVNPVLDECTGRISTRMNFKENTISFKRESISVSGVFTGKKRYMQKVLDNEDVRYAEPDYKITGIETNRSSTPAVARGWLLQSIKILLDTFDKQKLIEYIEEHKILFNSLPPEQIAFPRSANNLAKYADSNYVYSQSLSVPIAVRASLLYNDQIAKKNLLEAYEPIREGDKIKFLYLKEPNTLRENVIGFTSVLPKELNLHRYVDHSTQFEKVYLTPLTKIADAVGWQLVEESSLDNFF